MPHIVILGTCDTKLEEFLFLREKILESGGDACRVTLVDVGRTKVSHEAITVPSDVLTTSYAPKEKQDAQSLSRGELIKYMITCASNWAREAYADGLADTDKAIHGVIGAGGTGGTSLASGVMRDALPIGLPKMIVSTNASGDMGPVVGETDITMTYSVVDIAGTNTLLKRILSNAAGGIVGMATAYERTQAALAKEPASSHVKKVGLSMFGVTTPCVDQVRQYLESHYPVECFVFHSTGHGGKAMERLVNVGELDAVLDITTTEICDFICGGTMSAGPHRLEAPLKAGIPYVISLGATDMVNFGPKVTVPERYQGRQLYEHNPIITLMRTSEDECVQIGKYIVEKVREFSSKSGNVVLMLPIGGVSSISIPGGPFHHAAADKALFSTIVDGLKETSCSVIEAQASINDKEFALSLAKQLAVLMGFGNDVAS